MLNRTSSLTKKGQQASEIMSLLKVKLIAKND
jgi:hypothetical protein